MSATPLVAESQSLYSTESMDCLLEVAEATSFAPEILDSVLWRRLETMRARLSRLISPNEGDLINKAISTAYDDLPPSRQARVLMSAEFYDCISKISRDAKLQKNEKAIELEHAMHLSVLFDIISRERAIHELSSNVESRYLANCRPDKVWSPVGDVVAQRNQQGVWTLSHAPTIGDVVAIDFDSPLAEDYDPRSGVLSQTRLVFSAEEKELVIERLQKALDVIDSLEPIYGLLIRNFVRRVIVRKSVEQGGVEAARELGSGVFGSEHVHRQPGSIRLLNLHLDECTLVLCVEKLLHESTHNFLAAWETANGPFVTNDEKYRPISPWSGNPIPNSSLVHATFIYYMCHRLFEAFIASDFGSAQEDAERIRNKLGLFAAGFLIPKSVYEQLMLVGPPRPEVRLTLGTMQENIQQRYGYSA